MNDGLYKITIILLTNTTHVEILIANAISFTVRESNRRGESGDMIIGSVRPQLEIIEKNSFLAGGWGMKVVILCGGKGTRLREETEYRPKPMLPIGNRPILWHIMKIYAHYGHREFILCLGYKGEVIKDYFRNYLWNTCDATLTLGHNPSVNFPQSSRRRRLAGDARGHGREFINCLPNPTNTALPS
jgi:hypothetical protein